MRRIFLSTLVLLSVWVLVADSASAGWRRKARRCYEPCCVSSHGNSCHSSCEPKSCCVQASCCKPVTCGQPAPCCQWGTTHPTHETHGQTHQEPTKAPETPKAPQPLPAVK
jgi:hypothetical protein